MTPFQLPQLVPNPILIPHQPSFLGNKLPDGKGLLPHFPGFHEEGFTVPSWLLAPPVPPPTGGTV